MKYSKNGAVHSVTTMLALLFFTNSVALPGHAFDRATRAAATRPVRQEQAKPEDRATGPMGRIAFASDRDGQFEIYVANPDGGGQTRLTDNAADDVSPVWSPDGTRLAFVSYRDGNAEIYTMNADGSGPIRLTNNAANDSDPAWSPDGTKIAFTSSRGNTDEVYVMNADGTNQVNLTNNRAGDDFQPAWSPDGKSIAFVSNRDGNNEIYVMKADGTAQTDISNNAANDSYPTWSPMRITFQSDRDGNFEIYSMNAADGSAQVRLTNNAASDAQPSRSSDGARIAFASTRDTNNYDIYVIGADGSSPVRLTNISGSDNIQPNIEPLATQATDGSLQFSQPDYSVDEGGRSAVITVTRTGNTAGTAIVDYATSGGTASVRSNYVAASGTLTFAAGETSKTFTILIIDNAIVEDNKTVGLTLSNATGAVLGTLSTATLTIVDNDTTQATTNPIDDARLFVRQQYLDFLNREPDQAGSDYWTAQITQCGTNASCLTRQRAVVSAAFFIEQEYQQTAFFVYRFYRVAYNRRPTFAEFTRNRSQVIGGANQEASKTAFADNFILASAFTARYPTTMTAEQYVDALNTNTGGALTLTERNTLVNGLKGGTESRATVLRKLADNAVFRQNESNPAFVLSQYFGYLRRDPDNAGYGFWLDALNRTGNFQNMVCAFITSAEYQQRFSPVVTRTNADCGR